MSAKQKKRTELAGKIKCVLKIKRVLLAGKIKRFLRHDEVAEQIAEMEAEILGSDHPKALLARQALDAAALAEKKGLRDKRLFWLRQAWGHVKDFVYVDKAIIGEKLIEAWSAGGVKNSDNAKKKKLERIKAWKAAEATIRNSEGRRDATHKEIADLLSDRFAETELEGTSNTIERLLRADRAKNIK